jgi:hypothetical protein
MHELDDRTLLRTDHLDDGPVIAPSRSSRALIMVVATLGLLLGGAGAWWWTRDRSPVTGPPAAASGTEAVVAPSSEVARPLPPLHQMDTFLRALLGSLSASPELARWLATDDLIRQIANGIDRISRGLSPASELAVLRPQGLFAVSRRDRAMTIEPASYRRYDGLATLVSSLDARSVADAYRTIQPRLDEAYRGLGRAEGGIDNAVSIALQMLIDTPVVRGPVRLVPGAGATYAYADPELEGLRPIQKQLLRMGPDNVVKIQERLQQIKQAIETPATR